MFHKKTASHAFVRVFIFLIAMAICAIVLNACNTIEGFGKDVAAVAGGTKDRLKEN